jgi:capsular exopolysaccharide synthesis family protein
LFTPPLYTADATLELRGHAPVLSTIQSENLFGSDTRKIEYQKTTVAKLKLDGLADSVLSTDEIDQVLQRYWRKRRSLFTRGREYVRRFFPTQLSASGPTRTTFDLHFMHPKSLIQSYLSLIDIEPVHETNLVHVRATTADKKLSQKIANTHASAFIKHLQRERQDSILANVELLQAQAFDLKNRVTAAENQLNSYAAQNKLLLARNNEAIGLNNRHIETLAQMLADATGRRIKSESALTHAKKNREDEGSFLDTEITTQLRASLKQAETEYATLGSQVTAAYPSMRELNAKIVSLRKAIREERSRGIDTLQRQFDADAATELSLRTNIDNEKAHAQEVSKLLIQYDVLSKEASSLRELYQTVLKQAKEVEMSAAVTTANVVIADYAGLPTSPSAPKTNLIVILVTCVGLTSGVLLAYLLESLSDTIGTPEELQQTLQLPIIGSVPRFPPPAAPRRMPLPDSPVSPPGDSDPGTDPDASDSSPTRLLQSPEQSDGKASGQHAIITLSAPNSPVAEALRTIRANVLLSSADYPPRVIMLASSIPGEGKTTLLANLAVTLAQAKHRTLVIDGDLRLAGVSHLFGTRVEPREAGLTEVLTQHIPLEHAIVSSTVPGLDILPAGTKAPNPAELVGSESMKRLLQGLKDRYDFILLDTPPVMAVSDALLLSRMVDSVLFVVRSGVTPRAVARDAQQRLTNVKARIIGVILNDISPSSQAADVWRYGARYLEG